MPFIVGAGLAALPGDRSVNRTQRRSFAKRPRRVCIGAEGPAFSTGLFIVADESQVLLTRWASKPAAGANAVGYQDSLEIMEDWWRLSRANACSNRGTATFRCARQKNRVMRCFSVENGALPKIVLESADISLGTLYLTSPL
jgi:hypothetical protein